MSNLNHIIIPTIKNKPQPQEMNVFQSLNLCLTPQKEVPLSKILVDKKYHSAFKIYKQKKEKKQANREQPSGNQERDEVRREKKVVKLRMKDIEQATINKNNQQLYTFTLKPSFYDPNQAPLFTSDSQSYTPLPQQPPQILEKTEKVEEEIQVQLQQKIKIEPILEQETFVKYVPIPYQHDDPFIIMKKTTTKKDKIHKIDTLKSKLIKKDKKGLSDQSEKKKESFLEKYLKPFQTSKMFVLHNHAGDSTDKSEVEKKSDVRMGQEGAYSMLKIQRPFLVDQPKPSTIKPTVSSFLISRADIMI